MLSLGRLHLESHRTVFFKCSGDHRDLHSFPTRRSSDLPSGAGDSGGRPPGNRPRPWPKARDRKSTRLNSSHTVISYAVFCLKKKTNLHLNINPGVQPSALARRELSKQPHLTTVLSTSEE